MQVMSYIDLSASFTESVISPKLFLYFTIRDQSQNFPVLSAWFWSGDNGLGWILVTYLDLRWLNLGSCYMMRMQIRVYKKHLTLV